MKYFKIRYLLLLVFIPPAWGSNCGIPEKYLSGVSMLMYALSEVADDSNKKPIEAGSLILTWNLSCDKNEELKFSDCNDKNCENYCGSVKSLTETGKQALKVAEETIQRRNKELLIVGWASTNELYESGLPKLKGKLYLPGHKVLEYDMANDLKTCSDELVEPDE